MSKMPLIASIYNPKNQSKEDLIQNFVVRIKTFQRLFKDIEEVKMEVPEQHHLIVGKRGMGKTTLLLRLAYEVEQNEDLNTWLLPLVFNEEEYGIRKLYKFWVRIIELLEKKEPSLIGLLDQANVLSEQFEDDEVYEKEVFQLLANALKKSKKKIILFIDNIGDIFGRFSEYEAHRLRKILQTSSDIRIFGASSKFIESFFKYEHPFYEFFKMTQLKGLNQKETEDLLRNLGTFYQQEAAIEDILKHQKGRVSVLRKLTGGVIRTVVLLFEIFMDEKKGSAFKDLEAILDRVTPLYKHRMDDLPKQQQEIVEAIALHWMAITVKEIKQKTRMESKVISAQLTQLVKNGVVNRIPTTTKNHLYQLNERFFNIWYLMRCGRQSNRNSVLWLVKFFESWCRDEKEIVERVQKHIHHLRGGEYDIKAAYYVTEALSGVGHLPDDVRHELLQTTRKFLEDKNSVLLESLSLSDEELFDKINQAFDEKDYLSMANNYKLLKSDIKYYLLGLLYEEKFKDYDNAIDYYQKATNTKQENQALIQLGNIYENRKEFKKAEKCYLDAWNNNYEEAIIKLGFLFYFEPYENLRKAEKYFKIAYKLEYEVAASMLGFIYNELSDYKKAENYFLEAVELKDDEVLVPLAKIYKNQLKNLEKAEKIYKLGVKKNIPEAAHQLAHLYQDNFKDKSKQIEKLFKKAIELGDNVANGCLGMHFYRKDNIHKAISYLKKVKEEGYYLSNFALCEIYIFETQDYELAEIIYLNILNRIKKDIEDIKEYYDEFMEGFTFLLSREKYGKLLPYFSDKNNFKKEFQPIYFALMYYLQDKYPNEYLRMGDELKETVEEIIAEVEEMKKKYAKPTVLGQAAKQKSPKK